MHHPTDRIAHTMAFVTPVVDHWLEREIAQWVHHEGSIRWPITPWANALTTELYLAPQNRKKKKEELQRHEKELEPIKQFTQPIFPWAVSWHQTLQFTYIKPILKKSDTWIGLLFVHLCVCVCRPLAHIQQFTLYIVYKSISVNEIKCID